MIAALFALACGTSEPPTPGTPAEAGTPTPAEAAPAAPAADATAWKHFGAPFTVGEAVPAATVLADPAPLAGKVVRMKGELSEVCQQKGCWAVVRDDAGHAVRVTMKDYGFFIDKDTMGRGCDIEGQLIQKPVDPEMVKHFEEEGSKNPPEAGKTEAYELVATAIAVAPA